MGLTVGLLGFEPAIERGLRSLLRLEAGLQLVSLEDSPQVLIVGALDAMQLDELHRRQPQAIILRQLSLYAKESEGEHPWERRFEAFQGYSHLLSLVRSCVQAS